MGRIAERSLPLDPSMSVPWSTPPRESGAQQGITSDSFDSRVCQSVADPKPPTLWGIESFSGGLRLFIIDGGKVLMMGMGTPCVLQREAIAICHGGAALDRRHAGGRQRLPSS